MCKYNVCKSCKSSQFPLNNVRGHVLRNMLVCVGVCVFVCVCLCACVWLCQTATTYKITKSDDSFFRHTQNLKRADGNLAGESFSPARGEALCVAPPRSKLALVFNDARGDAEDPGSSGWMLEGPVHAEDRIRPVTVKKVQEIKQNKQVKTRLKLPEQLEAAGKWGAGGVGLG